MRFNKMIMALAVVFAMFVPTAVSAQDHYEPRFRMPKVTYEGEDKTCNWWFQVDGEYGRYIAALLTANVQYGNITHEMFNEYIRFFAHRSKKDMDRMYYYNLDGKMCEEIITASIVGLKPLIRKLINDYEASLKKHGPLN